MKIFNIIVISQITSMLVLSCSNKGEDGILNDEPITIQVEGATFEAISSKKLLENSEFVFLESNEDCHFGEMSTFFFAMDEFYVFDPVQKHMAFRFGRDGKFLNTIGKQGNGPGEYPYLSDAFIDQDTVEIMCGAAKSDIYRYYKNGDFIEKQEYEAAFCPSFVKVPETNDYLFYLSHGDHKIKRISRGGVLLDTLLAQKQEDRIGMTLDVFTVSSGGTVLVNEVLYNIIWRWDGEDFAEKYILDFGEYTFYQGEKDEERYFENGGGVERWNIRWCQANDDYLYVLALFIPPGAQSEYDVDFKHLLYSKEKNLTYQLGDGDINWQFRYPVEIDQENKLYLSGSPVEMSEWDAWMNIVDDQDLPFNIEGNPIVIIVDLDKLVK